MDRLRFVVLGLSITSSWGNGHATTYRSLLRALRQRGHDITFLERDVPWYADNRDLLAARFCRVRLYRSLTDLRDRFADDVAQADVVIVGSYVPQGIAVGRWVSQVARGTTAFYDIDTPVTLAQLKRGQCEYLSPSLIPRYALYLSFTGGPTLARLERDFGSPMARPLYCGVDPERYRALPSAAKPHWDLGYLGTYSADRQPALRELLIEPARAWPKGTFAVAGPMYPRRIRWPANVHRVDHVPPGEHARFYSRQRFTLNITRSAMRRAGYSPSVRLFEAGACGTPIISDAWPGLDELFVLGREILVARSSAEALSILRELPESKRREIRRAVRRRILAEHTADRRAEQLESYVLEAMNRKALVY